MIALIILKNIGLSMISIVLVAFLLPVIGYIDTKFNSDDEFVLKFLLTGVELYIIAKTIIEIKNYKNK